MVQNLIDHAHRLLSLGVTCRFGQTLLQEELQAFDPLRSDFEVSHRLEEISRSVREAQAAEGRHRPGQTPVQQRNRRLAAMQRLHEVGEYFSMDAMQERDPALFSQMIGGYMREQGEFFLSLVDLN